MIADTAVKHMSLVSELYNLTGQEVIFFSFFRISRTAPRNAEFDWYQSKMISSEKHRVCVCVCVCTCVGMFIN